MGKSSFRTWTPADEERLGELVDAVDAELKLGTAPDQAARVVIPLWAGCDSITELAEKAGVDRSATSRFLAGRPDGHPHKTVQERLEKFLRVPPGGLSRVLDMVAAVYKAQKNGKSRARARR